MRFYVYHLIDPRDAAVFYVGKGTGGRVFDHCREAANGKRSRKCDRIRQIAAMGLDVKHAIVERFADEDAAYAFEAEEILRLGLGALTNEVQGGRGGRSVVDELHWRVVRPALLGLAKHLRLIESGRSLLVGGVNFDEVARSFAAKLKHRHGHRFSAFMRRAYGCSA